MQANGRSVFNGRYVDVRALGRGQYGQVRLCVDLRTHELVAVKLCSKAALRCSPSRSRMSLDSRIGGVAASRSRLFASSARTAVPRTHSFVSVASHALRDASIRSTLAAPAGVPQRDGSCALDEPAVSVSDLSTSTRAAAGSQLSRLPMQPPPVAAVLSHHALRRASMDIAGLPNPAAPSDDMSAGSVQAPTLAHEVAILQQLDHPNIVKLHAAVDDPAADDLVLVLEHVSGGTLEQPRVGDGRCACLTLNKFFFLVSTYNLLIFLISHTIECIIMSVLTVPLFQCAIAAECMRAIEVLWVVAARDAVSCRLSS